MKEQIEEMGKLCPFYEEGKCNLLEDEAAECDFDCDMCDFARTLYNAGYRKQEWISVEDRLPEIAGKYLISRKTVYGNLINIVWYDTNYNGGNDDMIGKSVWYMFDGDWGDYEIPNVTHWMPLPEPPKMKGGAE